MRTNNKLKKVLSLVLSVVMVFTMIPTISVLFTEKAQAYTNYTKPFNHIYYYTNGTQFIYQLILYYSSKSNDKASSWLSSNGWTDWSGNFNAGDGHSSDYVHSGYKTTTNPLDAIKGILIADGHPTSVSYNGVTYYAVGSGSITQTPTGGDNCVDLNKGNGGDDLYLMATADHNAGPALTSITKSQSGNAGTAQNNLTNNGYSIVTDQSGNYQDTNAGAGGDYNYCGQKSSCTELTVDPLYWAYRMARETYENGYSNSTITSALGSAQTILADLNDGYTCTYTQANIDSAKNNLLSALPSISLNTTANVNISVGGEGYCYKFTASSSTSHAFWAQATESNRDNCAYIYNASGSQLAYNDDIGSSNSRHTALGVHNWQHYATADLSSGTTYYMYTKFLNSGTTSSYPVKVNLNRTIKFHPATNGNDVEVVNLPVGHPNTNFNTMAGFSRENHTLVGWSNNAGKAYQTVANVDTIPNNSDLYALWFQTDAPTLTANNDYTATIAYGYEMELYKFTPSVTRDYLIYGKSSTDDMVLLYDSNHANGAPEIAYDDDDNGGVKSNYGVDFGQAGTQFVLQKQLTAGQTYYYGVKFYSNGTGSLPFRFEEIYDVTYNANGGDGAPTAQKKFYGKNLTLSATSPSRTGYTFLGWSTSSTATSANSAYNGGATYSSNADLKLYAVWKANNYTVTLNNQGATSGGTAQVTATYDSAMPSATMPTKTGYTFGGYYSGENGAGTQYYTAAGASARTWNIAADTTLYAKWTANSYKVHFDGNGATSGSMSDQSFTYGVPQNLTQNAFGRAYTVTYNGNGGTPAKTSDTATYTFNGWALSATGAKAYNDKQSVSNLAPSGTKNLFANWTAKSVTLPAATRTGYDFNGWYSATSGGTKYGNANAAYTPTGNVAMTAQWTGYPYKVTFNGNGATAGTMTQQDFVYGTAQNLSENKYSRAYTVTFNYKDGRSNTSATANATFNGWATSASGAKVYNDKQNVSNLTTTKNGTFPLYANWTPGTVTPPTPTRNGYTFMGWYTNEACTTAATLSNGKYTPTANTVLYAKWDEISYTVTFDVDGGNAIAALGYKTSDTSALPAAEKTGYSFINWKVTSADGSWTANATYTAGTSVNGKYGSPTLKAQYSPVTYTITYVVDGVISTETYNIKSTGTLPAKTKTGYDFQGWAIGNNTGNWTETTPLAADTPLAGRYGDVTLTAQWKAKTYTATYNLGTGATTDGAPLNVDHDGTYTFTVSLDAGHNQNIPTVTAVGAAVSQTVSGNMITVTLSNVTGNVTVTVPTTPNTYTLTINGNAGFTSEDTGKTVQHGNALTFTITLSDGYTQTAPTVTKDGAAVSLKSSSGNDYTYEIGNVTADVTVDVFTTKNTYSVTLTADAGATVSPSGANTVTHGENFSFSVTPKTGYTQNAPTVKVNDASVTADSVVNGVYNFVIANVTEAKAVTVESTINKYTVTFKDEDGTVLLAAAEYDYGTPAADIATPADPTKNATQQYTYTFNGWDQEIADVTDDATYTATYSSTVNKYTVTFKDEDGTVLLAAAEYEYGTPAADIATPADPTKDATQQYTYTFAGWDSDIAAVTDNVTYTATYTSTVNKYTVTFVDEDGTVLKAAVEYDYGTPAADIETPADPTKPATQQYTFTFAGWDSEIAAVTDNVTYTATYSSSVNKYTVTFADENGTVLKAAAEYDYGTPFADIEKPATPTKPRNEQYTYTFAGWSPDPAEVTDNVTYTATYNEQVNKYEIIFVNENGTELFRQNLDYGETPVYGGETPVKAPDTQYSYTFAAWSPTISPVTGDQTYTATYSSTLNKYTVTFKDEDGTVLLADDYDYGTEAADIVLPAVTPTKAPDVQYTYTFAGWTPEIADVAGNATYTATYAGTLNKYTINFYNEDGETLLDSQEVEYGETPMYAGEMPTKAADAQYTYMFAAWSPTVASVTGAADYTATYSSILNAYEILFVDEDGTELDRQTLDYGETPVYAGEMPTKAQTVQYTYTFAGWDPSVDTVTGAVTYTATYTATLRSYTVRFLNEDGTVLETKQVPYGTVPTYTGATPTKAETYTTIYTFAGWGPALVPVAGNTSYVAAFSEGVNAAHECDYCHQVHTGAWGRLIQTIHNIFYIFLHIFGKI